MMAMPIGASLAGYPATLLRSNIRFGHPPRAGVKNHHQRVRSKKCPSLGCRRPSSQTIRNSASHACGDASASFRRKPGTSSFITTRAIKETRSRTEKALPNSSGFLRARCGCGLCAFASGCNFVRRAVCNGRPDLRCDRSPCANSPI